jgi:hypothetical protein
MFSFFRWSIHNLYLIILVVYMLSVSCILHAQEKDSVHPGRTMTAVRINPTTPKIDGILNDEVWRHAPASGDFLQKEPNEGEPATEKTTVQIVYDDEALYVGVMCYDSEPGKIVARLARRDGWVEADYVSIDIDAHHDHQTANWFMVNAAGVKGDGQIYNDTCKDGSWNGIWEARTAIHDQGWSAEYRIPYHTLRFSPKEEYVWGMHLGRYISRKSETDQWCLIRKGVNGWVSQLGHIEGIRGIHPPRHLEVMPFALGRSTFLPESPANPNGRDLFSSVGLDMRYGISSNISLNATFNPDFGQVEADPASLNLTAFETFYPERRPFFLEGSGIFSTPGSMLFYSRRIGRQPGQLPIPEDSEPIDKPDSTTILSAAKLTGKTASKTSFGIMNAITANEYATVERTYTDPVTGLEQTKQEKHLIEPLTNFFVGRVKQDVMKNSNVGAMLTAVNRKDDVPAYAAEVDGNLKWSDGQYSLSTRLAGSHTGPAGDRKDGYEAVANFHRSARWIGGGLNLNVRSPGFDVNDLGFVDRSGKMDSFGFIHVDIDKPWLLVRKMGFWTCNWTNWNYDGVDLGKGCNLYNWIETKNRWFMEWCISKGFEALNDTETRGGPLMRQPSSIGYFATLDTDGSKPVSLGFHVSGGRASEGLSSNHSLHLGLGIRPASYIQLYIGTSYGTGHNHAQWVKNTEDAAGKHYVFGELDNQTLDLSTRLNVSFTPDFSFQLYMQPFVAVGDYSSFKELLRPRSYEFKPYTNLDFNPDFSRRSLRSNAVLRWEYRPGSVLFLVWSQSRGASLEPDNPSLKPYESLSSSFTDEGENVFLIKLNCWLGL